MSYTKTVWVDDAAPPVNASNLNKIEQGIFDAHDLKLDKPLVGGVDGNVLKLASGVPTWGSGGGLTQIFDYVAGSAIASIDSNTILGGNIPQTYKALKLVVSSRSDQAGTALSQFLRLNNDSSSNYFTYGTDATGTSVSVASSGTGTSAYAGQIPGTGSFTGSFASTELYFPDYANASKHKVWLIRCFNGGSFTNADLNAYQGGGYLKVAAALTRLAMFLGAGNFLTDSRWTLFGEG